MAAPSGSHLSFVECGLKAQSTADSSPFARTRVPHGARENRGRTREASSAVRTKLSEWRPLIRNGCETGSWATLGTRSKRMPNVAAAGGRPAENGATPGSESLYLTFDAH